jgi:hypothetical protein
MGRSQLARAKFNDAVAGTALTIIPADSGNNAEAAKKWGSSMMKKLIGAAAVAAIVLSVAPAFAARVHSGCTSANLEKTETMVEGMSDANPAKTMAFKEITDAQDAMLSSKMGACAMHLGKAMHAGMMK